MSFRRYLDQRRPTDDAQGDFILVARLDPGFPDAKTWRELRK